MFVTSFSNKLANVLQKIMDFWWHFAFFCEEIVPIKPIWGKTSQGSKNMVMEFFVFHPLRTEKRSEFFQILILGAGHEQLKTKQNFFIGSGYGNYQRWERYFENGI